MATPIRRDGLLRRRERRQRTGLVPAEQTDRHRRVGAGCRAGDRPRGCCGGGWRPDDGRRGAGGSPVSKYTSNVNGKYFVIQLNYFRTNNYSFCSLH